MVPSKKVVELVFTSNHATFGSIPDFFGGLTNLTALGLTDNPFKGNIPGKALVISVAISSTPRHHFYLTVLISWKSVGSAYGPMRFLCLYSRLYIHWQHS